MACLLLWSRVMLDLRNLGAWLPLMALLPACGGSPSSASPFDPEAAVAATSDAGADAAPIQPSSPARALNASDVSTLFAPPRDPREWDLLLTPSQAGPRGALLPLAIWKAMNEPMAEATLPDNDYSRMRVVAFRIDPCFRVGGDSSCQAQVRLVWQPTNGADAAAHTFYALSQAELRTLVSELIALRGARSDREPAELSVHPIVAAEGPSGPYAAALKQLVLRHAGQDNLQRLAVFSFPGSFPDAAGQQQWRFRAFDVAGASVTPRPVTATSTSDAQVFETDAAVPHPSSTSPRIDAPEACNLHLRATTDFASALTSSSEAVCALEPAAAVDRVRVALRFENPAHTASDSTSCANCHASTTLRLVAEHRFSIDSAAFAERAGREPDHRGTSFEYFGVTRMFGFHAFGVRATRELRPAVSPRTVYETRAVLAQLGY